jgi:hypothetical protein
MLQISVSVNIYDHLRYMYNYFKIGLIIVTYSTCMSSGKIFDLKMSQLRRGQITLYDVIDDK